MLWIGRLKWDLKQWGEEVWNFIGLWTYIRWFRDKVHQRRRRDYGTGKFEQALKCGKVCELESGARLSESISLLHAWFWRFLRQLWHSKLCDGYERCLISARCDFKNKEPNFLGMRECICVPLKPVYGCSLRYMEHGEKCGTFPSSFKSYVLFYHRTPRTQEGADNNIVDISNNILCWHSWHLQAASCVAYILQLMGIFD